MQSKIEKKQGHIRKSSCGSFEKIMPISSLLINNSCSPRYHLESIAQDGLTPEHECEPLIFDNRNNSYSENVKVTVQNVTNNNSSNYNNKSNIEMSFTADSQRHRCLSSNTNDKSSRSSIKNNNDKTKISDIPNDEGCRLLSIPEAVAKTSMMTSPAARRRLMARKLQMDLKCADGDANTDPEYIPPKQLLIYLVR